jgi:membrane-associated phospholipid phosphatase
VSSRSLSPVFMSEPTSARLQPGQSPGLLTNKASTAGTALMWVGGLAALSVLARRPRPGRFDQLIGEAAAGLPHGRAPVALGTAVTAAGAPTVALGGAVTALMLQSRRCRQSRQRWRNGGAGARGDLAGVPPTPESPERGVAGLGVRGWAAVILTGLGARRVLSRVIRRARPPQSRWWTTPHGFSYPSKHATASALAALAVLESRHGRGPDRISAAGIAIAGAVGASRVYLGVHWASDVLGGWLFAGAWTALAGRLLDRRFMTHRPHEQSQQGGRT